MILPINPSLWGNSGAFTMSYAYNIINVGEASSIFKQKHLTSIQISSKSFFCWLVARHEKYLCILLGCSYPSYSSLAIHLEPMAIVNPSFKCEVMCSQSWVQKSKFNVEMMQHHYLVAPSNTATCWPLTFCTPAITWSVTFGLLYLATKY